MQEKRVVCHVKDDYVSRRARFNALLFKIEGRFKILSERVNAMFDFTSSGCEIITMANIAKFKELSLCWGQLYHIRKDDVYFSGLNKL